MIPEAVSTANNMPRAGASWLTVIMPTHCGEDWIDASLGSLAAEQTDGIEVLLLDSSPTSATRDTARTYSDRLDLRIIECRDLPAWTDKTNFGVDIAGSNHICWLHQDDVWLPGRAAAVRAWIDATPEASLHLAPCAIIDRKGRNLGVWRCPLPVNDELPSARVTERLLVQNFIAAPAPVFRKDAWLACGGLDGELWYTADWDIWLKLASSGPVHYHDSVTTGFRIHGGSLTVTGSRNLADFAQQMEIVLERHLPRLGGRAKSVERAGRASIVVNTALASAAAGQPSGLLRAASEVLRLGPAGTYRYLRDSRIMDRMLPRVRAKLEGAF
jgi:glycosyltransferase involved in cell wall biosynthesis